jgi:hypothetical protein
VIGWWYSWSNNISWNLEGVAKLQHFAIATVSPRSIAWLIRLDEWDRFEKIVKYNCAMQGGYFNVMIPLTDQDTISIKYQRLLVDYDPDLVVLAPHMMPTNLESLAGRLHPFAFKPSGCCSKVCGTHLDIDVTIC